MDSSKYEGGFRTVRRFKLFQSFMIYVLVSFIIAGCTTPPGITPSPLKTKTTVESLLKQAIVLKNTKALIYTLKSGKNNIFRVKENLSLIAPSFKTQAVTCDANLRVYVEAFNIDDNAHISVNGTSYSFGYGQAIQRRDVTANLIDGENAISFSLTNLRGGHAYGFRLIQNSTVIFEANKLANGWGGVPAGPSGVVYFNTQRVTFCPLTPSPTPTPTPSPTATVIPTPIPTIFPDPGDCPTGEVLVDGVCKKDCLSEVVLPSDVKPMKDAVLSLNLTGQSGFGIQSLSNNNLKEYFKIKKKIDKSIKKLKKLDYSIDVLNEANSIDDISGPIKKKAKKELKKYFSIRVNAEILKGNILININALEQNLIAKENFIKNDFGFVLDDRNVISKNISNYKLLIDDELFELRIYSSENTYDLVIALGHYFNLNNIYVGLVKDYLNNDLIVDSDNSSESSSDKDSDDKDSDDKDKDSKDDDDDSSKFLYSDRKIGAIDSGKGLIEFLDKSLSKEKKLLSNIYDALDRKTSLLFDSIVQNSVEIETISTELTPLLNELNRIESEFNSSDFSTQGLADGLARLFYTNGQLISATVQKSGSFIKNNQRSLSPLAAQNIMRATRLLTTIVLAIDRNSALSKKVRGRLALAKASLVNEINVTKREALIQQISRLGFYLNVLASNNILLRGKKKKIASDKNKAEKEAEKLKESCSTDECAKKTGDFKKSQTGKNAKEASKDTPSWAKNHDLGRPYSTENGGQFADRMMKGKYGENWRRFKQVGPRSEYQRIQKYGDRAFR